MRFSLRLSLIRVYRMLEEKKLRVPGNPHAIVLPLCQLDSLGALGPDRKRISEGFTVTHDDWTPYPGFWGHNSKRDRTIGQQLNCHLAVWLESPRGPNYGPHLWERAGRILLVERLRMNTHRLIAIGFEKDVLGNVWWALKPCGLTLRQGCRRCRTGGLGQRAVGIAVVLLAAFEGASLNSGTQGSDNLGKNPGQ